MGILTRAEDSDHAASDSSPTPGADLSKVVIILISLGLTCVVLVVLAAVSYQCTTTWRWLRTLVAVKEETAAVDEEGQRDPVGISHSLPDLQPGTSRHEYVREKEVKKDLLYILSGPSSRTPRVEAIHPQNPVLRQTTLPTVPTRHQTFQRQLSHRLDFENIEFSICKRQPKKNTLGKIKPELYLKELVQESKDESEDPEMICAGKLHFAMKYDMDMDALVVKVLEARDLPVKDMTGSSDPYVKLFLLPDRKKKFQTKVHRKNLDPIFNETFIFSVTYDDLKSRSLQFFIYDFDRFTRHDLIGQVILKGLLDSTDLLQEIEYTMNILCPPPEKKRLGELMISLCFLPTAGRLTVTVLKGRSLKAMDITGTSDPYVKVYMVYDGKMLRKKRTSVKPNTLYPVFNEALNFDVPATNIEDITLIIKVIDYDRIGSNELMGCCVISKNIVGVGKDHWLQMLEYPRKPVTQWYPLLESVPLNLLIRKNNKYFNCLSGRFSIFCFR